MTWRRLARTAGNAVVVDGTGDVVGLLSESVLGGIVDPIIDAGELADRPEDGVADAAPLRSPVAARAPHMTRRRHPVASQPSTAATA